MGVGLTTSPVETDGHRWLRDRSRSRLQGKARVMLKNLSAEIRECYKHAENWVHKAAAQSDPKLKANFLNLELRRLLLARSDEFTKRLADLSSEAKRRAEALPAKN
jgi:hypothetical protein